MYEFILRLFKYNQGDRGKFWYSRKQARVGNPATRIRTNYVKLDSGRIVRYSEMSNFHGKSNWDDAKYLGRGRWYKVETRRTL